MTGRTAGARLNGDDLIGEVLRNMEEGLFRIRRKTIVPSIYRIYLSSADYEPFRDVVPFIAGEIRAALDERLAGWNGSRRRLAKSLLEKIGAGDAVETSEFVRLTDSWTVEIYPDLDAKLQPGEIEVYSDLGAPQKQEYGAGSLTRRIFPQGAPSAATPGTAPGPATPGTATPGPGDEATVMTATATPPPAPASSPVSAETNAAEKDREDDGTKGRAFAYIRYVDQHGQKTFEVTKNQMVIGRGGRSYWVDLRLETLPDVSREHCRIRRDAETGRFTIEDASQFGTAVNGKPVLQNNPVEIPRRATISLAGVIDLQWEAV
jgi:hypothetical protein